MPSPDHPPPDAREPCPIAVTTSDSHRVIDAVWGSESARRIAGLSQFGPTLEVMPGHAEHGEVLGVVTLTSGRIPGVEAELDVSEHQDAVQL